MDFIKNLLKSSQERYTITSANTSLCDEINSLKDRVESLERENILNVSRIEELERENISSINAMYEISNSLEAKIDEISTPTKTFNNDYKIERL
jgi:hypothetical protein